MTNVGAWASLIVDQLDFYMEAHLLPRLEGLTDEEFFWEPVEACWSVRPRANGWALDGDGGGGVAPPVTTIGWRLCHIAVENIGTRANAFFGSDSRIDGHTMHDDRYAPPVPGTAEGAVALLVDSYRQWRGGLARLDDDAMLAPLGPVGGPFADDPMAALALHVSRETIHHGGEIGTLRDLFIRLA
jgi:DinB superfamily